MISILICVLLAADPSVQLPASIQVKPGRLAQITAKTEQKIVKWFLIGDEADLIVMESTRAAIFSATNPGAYRVLAWVASGDIPSDPAICTIQVGDAPLPSPPVPPSDPLLPTLQGIYGSIQDIKKEEYKKALTSVYRQAVTIANDPQIKTTGELYGTIRRTASKFLPDDALQSIRERLAEEMTSVLPADFESVLNLEIRKKAMNIYTRLANILEALQ